MFKLKIFSVILAVVIFSGCADRTALANTNTSSCEADISSSQPIIPEKKKPQKVSFIAAGDNLIHDAIYMQASKRAGGNGYDFGEPYSRIEKYVKSADIAMLNQETPLASKIAPLSNYPLFNSPVEVGGHMVDIGFDVINHANNHVYDTFEAGLVATLDYWDTQKSATVIGAHRTLEEKNKIDYITKNDVKFAFLGYTQSTNGLQMPANSTVGTTFLSEFDFITKQIKEARENSDIVVVSLHWGDENATKPNAYQKKLANDLVNLGVDLVVGTHSHVIQEGEFIKRADGSEGYVIYSLGNFISAQREVNNFAGGFLKVEFIKDYETEKTAIDKVEFIPTVAHYGSGVSQVKIYPFDEYTPQLANIHGVHKFQDGFSYELLQRQFDAVEKSTKRK